MKKLIINITILLLCVSLAQAQTIEPKAQKETPVQAPQEATEQSEPNLSAEDANKNQNSKVQENDNKNPLRKRAAEHFEDKDGDGINDNRCNGFGVQKRNQKGRRGGKK